MSLKRSVTRRESVLTALVIAAMSLLFLHPSIRGFDGPSNYVFLMSLLNDGDLDFHNEYRQLDARTEADFRFADLPLHPGTGLPVNQYGVGSALFWSPFVVPLHCFLKVFHPAAATGLSRPYEWAVGVGSAFWAGLGLWLFWRRLRETFSAKISALTLLSLTFATSLCFYQWAHISMSHAVGFFCAVMVLLTLERCLHPKEEWEESKSSKTHRFRSVAPFFTVGFWSGLLVITRFQDATWAITVGIGLVWFPHPARQIPHSHSETQSSPALSDIKCRVQIAASFLVGFVLALLPQMAVWKVLFGTAFTGPQPYMNRGVSHFELLPVHFWELLFSGRHGALAWHPVLALGLVGLIGMWKRPCTDKAFPAALLVIGIIGIVLQIYLLSAFSIWWAGASFGNRYFISSYPWLGLGWASLLYRIDSRHPKASTLLVSALIVWNIGLLVQYATQMISREQEVSWQTIIDNQFRAVPRLLGSKLLRRP